MREQDEQEREFERAFHLPEHNWTPADNRAFDYWGEKLGGNVMFLYLLLCRLYDERRGYAYPTIATMAKRTKSSDRTVKNRLKILEESNLLIIRRFRGYGKANEYIPQRLTIPKSLIPPNDLIGKKQPPTNTEGEKAEDLGGQNLPTTVGKKQPPTNTKILRSNNRQQHRPLGTIVGKETTGSQNVVVDGEFSSSFSEEELEKVDKLSSGFIISIQTHFEDTEGGEAELDETRKAGIKKLVGEMVAKYGLDNVVKQYSYVASEMGKGKVENPEGFFRDACRKNYSTHTVDQGLTPKAGTIPLDDKIWIWEDEGVEEVIISRIEQKWNGRMEFTAADVQELHKNPYSAPPWFWLDVIRQMPEFDGLERSRDKREIRRYGNTIWPKWKIEHKEELTYL